MRQASREELGRMTREEAQTAGGLIAAAEGSGCLDVATLQTLIENIPGGVTLFDRDLRMITCNSRFRELLGFPDSLFARGLPAFEQLLHFNAGRGEYGPDSASRIAHILEQARAPQPHCYERVRPDGRVLEIRGTPLPGGGFVTIYIDVTERKRAEEEAARYADYLRRVNGLFEDAITYSPTYVWEVDAEGRFTFLKGTEKVLGYAPDELLGKRFGELRCRDSACRETRDKLDSAFREGRPYEHIVTCAIHKNGSHRWVSASAHPIVGAGAFAGYRGVGFDVTETTLIRQELERMALMDPLTGLANRRKFLERFKLEVERQQRHGQPLSLLVLDVDHFKQVNDQFGHLTGDMCLKCVADLLILQVRKIDQVARFGGEEFLVLLPETGSAGALVAAEKLRAAIENLNIPIESRFEPVNITVSLGVSTMAADHPLSFDDLMEQADQGLYAAKNAGRNRVGPAFATPSA